MTANSTRQLKLGFSLHVSGPTRFAASLEPRLPRTEYPHDILRGHQGLPVPENRWSRAAVPARAAAAG